MRRSFPIVSIVVHAALIAAAFVAQILADGALPTPHRAVLFDPPQIMAIALPPAPARRPAAARAESRGGAPIQAPEGVRPEPEHPPADPPSDNSGVIAGIDG